MGTQCPKCGGHHTQAISAVVQSGTTQSTGSMTGIGVGTDSVGTFVGMSNSTSQTILASRFAAPKKPKKLEMIAGSVLVLATSPWLFSKTPLAFISLGLAAWLAWEIFVFRKRNKEYQARLPDWQWMYKSCSYCHSCTNVFPNS